MSPATRQSLLQAGAAALVLCVAACSGDGRPAGGATAGPAPPPLPVTSEEVLERIRRSDAPVKLVNVWATWCLPCREEFPALVKLHRDLSEEGLEVYFLSVDFGVPPERIAEFLTAQGVTFETYLKDEPDQAFLAGFHPDWDGAIPATFIYDRGGRLRKFIRGKAEHATFDAEVRSVLADAR